MSSLHTIILDYRQIIEAVLYNHALCFDNCNYT